MFSYYIVFSGVCKINYQGLEKLGRRGQIILCNHPSLLDVVFLFSRISNTNIVVKKELLKNPVMIGQVKACGFLVNEDISVESAVESLNKEAILLFPEGTRTRLNEKNKFNRAAISFALHTAKIITPVKIKMQPANWTKGQKWWKIPTVRPKYEFIVGQDIIVADYLANTQIPIAARKLTTELENYFNQK
ncbi:MAG: 1-acyl-sn-glycerol-3-phosphate acyltransferase [Cardiobacteriaceae bacterium]|nr:1-acyl-sn-glycerol-3-phosphate acyltransferase [Cardiobacteriaceae bacterium]